MPRTSAVECSGCPPIRALTFDVLGLIKVTEASKNQSIPKVVERWGEPDSSQCVLAASMNDSKLDPLLAVARKNGRIEVLNPLNGELHVRLTKTGDEGHIPEDDPIIGLHLFKKERAELSRRSCTFLSCTTKGNAILRSIEIAASSIDSTCPGSPAKWNVCDAGSIVCCRVDESENFALFGGKRVEVNVWDIDKCSKIWTAKPPPKNNLGIFTPTWITAATFLSREDHRKVVAGTQNHQVRLYDISAQRRPVLSFDFRESSITAIAEDIDGYTVYIGTGSGDLASVDMRTGKLLGCFVGKSCGSIRSIARHSELPVVVSCGLDSYLRFWDTNTRQPLSAVFLKQQLTIVVIDSNFTGEVNPPSNGVCEADPIEVEEGDAILHLKKRKSSKESKKLKPKKKKTSKRLKEEDDDLHNSNGCVGKGDDSK